MSEYLVKSQHEPAARAVYVKPPCKQSIALPLIQKDLALRLPTVLCGQGGREVARRDRLH